MARDRQKAKQRKAKRDAQQQKNAQRAADKAKRSEGREERLEEIEEEGVGREAMTNTGIASEVALDQARMDADLEKAAATDDADSAKPAPEAEAAAPHVQETKRQRRQRERAEQQTREASKKTARGRRSAGDKQGKQGKQGKQPREHGRVRTFFKQVWAELKRVQWPTRDQVLQATGVVAGFCLIAGLYLAFWDYVWSKTVDALF